MSYEIRRLTPEQYMDEVQVLIPDWDRTALPIQPSDEANIWIMAEANRHAFADGCVKVRDIGNAVRRAFELGLLPAFSGVVSFYVWALHQVLKQQAATQ